MQHSAEALQDGKPALAIALALLLGLLALPPRATLGATGPFFLKLSLRHLDRSGATAGRLSAASTLGSIAGTVLAAFAGLPLLGTARCLASSALLLAMAAGAFVRWPRRLAFAAAPAAALLLAPLALPRHPSAIDAHESAYALVQTLEQNGVRDLILDQSFALQSRYRAGAPVRDEPFTHAPLALAAAMPIARPRVLLLGLGAGTAARALYESVPSAEIVGIELDAEAVRQARAHFALPASVEVHLSDARAWLAAEPRSFDLIFVDAFRFPYVPFHLATLEFAQLVADHLRPGGVALFNVGRWGQEKQVVDALGATLSSVFPEVLAADAGNRSNTLLYAGEPGLRERLAAQTPDLPQHLQRLAVRVSALLQPAARGEPMTDDLAPVEAMTDGILLRALVQGGGRL